MRCLPASYARFLAPLLTSLCMTCAVSAIATWRAVSGWSAFLAVWPSSWMVSWAIAYPVMLLAMPLARRFSSFICAEK